MTPTYATIDGTPAAHVRVRAEAEWLRTAKALAKSKEAVRQAEADCELAECEYHEAMKKVEDLIFQEAGLR